MKVLVIDVGGSHVKLCASGAEEARRFDSGPDLTPPMLVARVHEMTRDWTFDTIAFGYPGRVNAHGPVAEPPKLGPGWVDFDFAAAFARPIRIVNDAVLQALGAYDGGRMLFLGLGTGLGSVLVAERVVIPMELGLLRGPETDGLERLGDLLGKRGLKRLGETRWVEVVRTEAVRRLRRRISIMGRGDRTARPAATRSLARARVRADAEPHAAASIARIRRVATRAS